MAPESSLLGHEVQDMATAKERKSRMICCTAQLAAEIRAKLIATGSALSDIGDCGKDNCCCAVCYDCASQAGGELPEDLNVSFLARAWYRTQGRAVGDGLYAVDVLTHHREYAALRTKKGEFFWIGSDETDVVKRVAKFLDVKIDRTLNARSRLRRKRLPDLIVHTSDEWGEGREVLHAFVASASRKKRIEWSPNGKDHPNTMLVSAEDLRDGRGPA